MNKLTKAFAVIMLMMVVVVSCTKPETPNNDGNNNVNENDSVVDNNDSLNGHDYVDLGLPSGTLWATCNVGADTPEGVGNYFAWGEIVPKDSYDWESYKYGDVVNQSFEMTKYCTDSCWGLNGFVDGLTVLEPADDAATANWGADWRMPTKEEWEELYQNTTCTLAVQNGAKGRVITGCNGKCIFLPFTGFRLNEAFIGPSLGIYWSSSLHLGFPERGWSFHYDLDECHVCGTYERSRGQVVRAVRAVR